LKVIFARAFHKRSGSSKRDRDDYGVGFDKIDTNGLRDSRVLVIAGSEDTGATQAAIIFSPA